MKVTIGIKSLNEEGKVANAVASAIEAVRLLGGEVILADSGSTDETIAIAKRFPIRIVQLANGSERSCGAGAQLAFQHARGTYFYLLDADMVLQQTFLPTAVDYLEGHPDVAAVGGRMRDCVIQNEEFEIRKHTAKADLMPGVVDRLDGGGLYRTAAVREVGYFGDRNLHSFEEFDLAARLRCRGWTLARLDDLAVHHYGHAMAGYRLLWRRLTSKYSRGAGEVLRAAIGRPHLGLVLRELGHIRNGLVVIAWWLLLIETLIPPVHLFILLPLGLGPVSWLWFRRGSLRLGLFSLASWNITAFGLIAGFVRRRVSPLDRLAYFDITSAAEDKTAVQSTLCR